MLTTTLIQTNLYWEDKEANLAMLQNKIENIIEHTDIVILPEMFSTGFSMQSEIFAETMEGETIDWMRSLAIEKKIILCGSIIIKEENKCFNRFIWMQPNGTYNFYDKRHLFAFAGEDAHYHSGNKKLIIPINGLRVNCNVCYDLRFPVWTRQTNNTEEQYDVLLYVANWPERRSRAWKTLLVARAIENQCYVIGVNRIGEDGKGIYYSGNSMVIDPLGEILYHKADEDDIFTITLDKTKIIDIRTKFPFLKDSDTFEITL
jgi:predicted amidohydrolase